MSALLTLIDLIKDGERIVKVVPSKRCFDEFSRTNDEGDNVRYKRGFPPQNVLPETSLGLSV
jgi:hypothetical protein